MLPARRKTGTTSSKSALGRALERFSKNHLAKADGAAPAVSADEFFVVHRCAVTGRYFKTPYARGADGKFFAKPHVKVVETGSQASGTKATAASSTVRVDQIGQFSAEPCPWCQSYLAYTFVRCSSCNELVCTGRSYHDAGGFMFVCSDACGTRGRLGEPVSEFAAERQRPAAPPQSVPAREPRRALTAQKKPLIGRSRQ
jgi:hypothetical protein